MKNKKGLISIISLFMCVALVSIGFAAWVITGDGSTSAEGNINVATVTDARISIGDLQFVTKEGNTEGAAKDIVFLGSRDKSPEDWLQVEKGENLVVYLKGNVTSPSDTLINNDPDVKIEVLTATGEDASAKFAALQNFNGAELIKELPTEANGKIVATLGEDTDTGDGFKGELNIAITFEWGTAFNGTNPQLYYNDGQKTSATNGDEALARLNAIYSLNSLKYKITVAVKNN